MEPRPNPGEPSRKDQPHEPRPFKLGAEEGGTGNRVETSIGTRQRMRIGKEPDQPSRSETEPGAKTGQKPSLGVQRKESSQETPR